MTPEEIAALQESGETPEAIAAKQAIDVEAVRVAAEEKAKTDAAARAAVLASLSTEEIEQTAHYKGTIGNLQHERAERQRAEQEATRLRLEAETREKAEVIEEEPDKVMTVGEFNKRVDAKVAELQKTAEKNRMKNDAAAIQQRLADSEAKAKTELTAEKMGPGLDYNSVFAATERMIAQNPAYAGVIMNAKDPARQAYDIGLLDPQIQVLREAQQMKVTLSKIKDGGAPPKVGGGGGAGPDVPGEMTMEELLNLSPAELKRRTEILENQGG